MGVFPASGGTPSATRRDSGTRQPFLTSHFLALGNPQGDRARGRVTLTEPLECLWCPDRYLRGRKESGGGR